MVKRRDVLEKAIKFYGKDKQMIVAIEELSELQKEICKWQRGIGNYDHVVEEVADVIVMIEYLKLIFEINDKELEKAIDYKLKRLDDNINKAN